MRKSTLTPTVGHWLSVRIRLTCLGVLLIGSLLPPYVPKASLAPTEVTIAQQQFLLVEEGFIMKSSSLTNQGARRAYAQGIIHTVKGGESIDRLADRYGIEPSTIRNANDLGDGGAISPGDEILILPVDGVLHHVSRGQTLSRIAQLYDIPQKDIVDQNDLKGGFLLAGQELIIPGGSPIVGKPTEIAMADEPPPEVIEVAQRPPSPDRYDERAIPAQKPPAVEVHPTGGVLQKPCSASCYYTQHYRPGHYAVDMQDRGGGPVFAAEAGRIVRAEGGWNGGYGNVIEVDHGNGLVTLYAHNKEHYVSEGDIVQRGQLIAWMGNTGRVYGATGIHVHFEVRLNGIKKNPLLYLE